MKKCPNNHENPDNAKFCRICGCQIHDTRKMPKNVDNQLFTPDIFPDIKLLPCSVVNIDFEVSTYLFGVVFSTVLSLLFLFAYLNTYEMGPLILLLTFIFALIYCIILLLRKRNKRDVFNMNADYIEESPFIPNIYRIAKEGKLGLFNRGDNSVLLPSLYTNITRFNETHLLLVEQDKYKGLYSLRSNVFIIPFKKKYDSITKFDDDHILVRKNGMNGLFSLNKWKLIVPVEFNHIDSIKNSMVKCYKGTELSCYDVYGNRMK